jgi:membrane protein
MSILRKSYYFIKQVIEQFCIDGCFNRAAALAYTTLLSLVPFLTLVFGILSAFPAFRTGLAQQMEDFIFENFVATAAKAVEQNLRIFIEHTTHLSAWGFLFLLITAVLLVFSIEQAFNLIWRVKRRREDVLAFLLYWGVITFVPILLGAGLALSSYLFSLPTFLHPTMILWLKKILLFLTPYCMTYTAFAVLYISLPNCTVPQASCWIAAAPVTILFELAKQGFTLYIVHFPTYELIYGALATLPIFLLWLYVSWLIILFGAVMSYVISVNFFPKLLSVEQLPRRE